MTMNVLASVMTPATAKTAHKPKGAPADGSETTDFAAMLEAAPTGTGLKAVAAAKSKQGAKPASSPDVQEGSLPAEALVAETGRLKSKAKQDKAAKDDESADAVEPKVHMPNESASAVAQAVVPIATAHTKRGEGEPTKGSVISSIASGISPGTLGKGQTPATTTTTTTTTAAGASTDAAVPVTSEAAVAEEDASAATGTASANSTQTDSATGQIKPGEATELLRQLSSAFEKKAPVKAEAQPAPQNALPASGTSGEARPAIQAASTEAGPVESPRSGMHGAQVNRTDTGRVEVVQPEVARATAARAEAAHSEAIRTETGQADLAQGKQEVAAPLVRSAAGNSNSAKLAEGTAPVAIAADNGPVAQKPTAQGEGERSDRRDERGRDAKAVAPSGDTTSSSPVVASSFAIPAVTSDAVVSQSTGAVSAALGQQVIDMGVSGQWLDSLSHQIATVAASNGQGSFSIAPENLGGVRVDITQGDAGANIRMTVGNEAARFALQQDSDRLLKDAQLSSIRIADFQVDMVAQAGNAQGSDMSQNGQGQQQNGQNASGWTSANGNSTGQGQRNAQFAASGQGAGNGSGGNQPKFGGNNAVSNEMKRADGAAARTTEAQRARYA